MLYKLQIIRRQIEKRRMPILLLNKKSINFDRKPIFCDSYPDVKKRESKVIQPKSINRTESIFNSISILLHKE